MSLQPIRAYKYNERAVKDGRGLSKWRLPAQGSDPTRGILFELFEMGDPARRCAQPGEDDNHIVIETGCNSAFPGLMFDIKTLPLLSSGNVQTAYKITFPEVRYMIVTCMK